MSGKRFATYVAAAALSFTFGACNGGGGGDDGENICVLCPAGAGAAIWCSGTGAGLLGMCGATADLAAFHCIEAGGVWTLAEVCPPQVDNDENGDGETGSGETGSGETGGHETGGGGDGPWEPGRDVTFDQTTGEFIIDRHALDALQRNPGVLFADPSTLEQLEAGYFMLTASGPLSDALGWQSGDILLDANGHELVDTEAVVDAYPELSRSETIELTVDRDDRVVLLHYRIK